MFSVQTDFVSAWTKSTGLGIPSWKICISSLFWGIISHQVQTYSFTAKLLRASFFSAMSVGKQMATLNSGELPPFISDGGNQITSLPVVWLPLSLIDGNFSSLSTLACRLAAGHYFIPHHSTASLVFLLYQGGKAEFHLELCERDA
ncbi:hypothetical protein ISCGN_029785 [Ixodes scapularis]